MAAWTLIVACGTASWVRRKLKKLGRGLEPGDLQGVARSAVAYAEATSGTDYLDAVEAVHDYGRAMAGWFQDWDILLSATLAEPPAKVGRFTHDRDDYLDYRTGKDGVFAYSPFTASANATGQPAISLPLGQSAGELPIGSHLTARLFERGDRVTVIDDFNDFYDPRVKRRNVAAFLDRDDYRLVEGDIRDRELVDRTFEEGRFDAVVHLAARAGVRPSLREPLLYEEVNCIGTLHLLEAARHIGPDVFIFGSSSSVYGINEKVPFAEDDPVDQPISPYATTKRTGELLCYNYHHLYGLKTSCLRFFTVYGPAQRPEMAIHRVAATSSGRSPTAAKASCSGCTTKGNE